MFDKQKLYNLTLIFSDVPLDSLVEVYDLIHDDNESYKLFKAWHQYFVQHDFDIELIRKYFNTYWKWYVMVTWKNFSSLDEILLSQTIPYQFMMAFRLGYDITNFYANQIVSFIPEDKIQDTTHGSISEQIKNSQLPFDYHSGKTVAELVRDIQNITRLDEFERSQIYADIEVFLFEEEDIKTNEEKLKRVNELFDFFTFMSDPKAIQIFRKVYTDTAIYLPGNLIDSVIEEITMGTDNENISIVVEKNAVEKSYNTIRAQVLSLIEGSYGDDGDEKILAALQKISEDSNDPHILDLYYYDEQSGKFVWNEELLEEKE